MNPAALPKRGKVVVFAGDSVKAAAQSAVPASRAARLVYRPPAGLGDIWGHIRADVSALVVIDCRHSDAPSVWHREIGSALDAGLAVFGAGGIGALRAAEVNGMGMIGVGEVFNRVQNGLLEDDDEVLSGADGFALVTLRLALEQALQADVVTAEEAVRLLRYCRTCFYPKRSWQGVRRWIEDHIQAPRRQAMAAFIETCAVDPRCGDALSAIGLALSAQQSAGSIRAQRSPVAEMMRPKWRLCELFHRSFAADDRVVSGALVLNAARELRHAWATRLKKAFFIAQWMKEQNRFAPPEIIEGCLREAMAKKGAGLDAFLLANAMTLSEWKGLLGQARQVSWAEQQRSLLLPGSEDAFGFAEAWALSHGVAMPLGGGLSGGRWVVHRGPAFFGLVWEEDVAFMDALRLSGLAARYAASADPGGADDR